MPNSARRRDVRYHIAKQLLTFEVRFRRSVEPAVMSGEFDARAVVFNHPLRGERRAKKRRRALQEWPRS
jgi:hypothetical protein